MTTTAQLMEQASEALAKLDYLECESLCLRALAKAREEKNWPEYGRILMPLQECRRQRRMIAAEGVVRLGTAGLLFDAQAWLAQLPAGCIVVTRPHRLEQAAALLRAARQGRRCVEVMYADNDAAAACWRLRPITGADLICEVAGPPAAWTNQWISPPTGEESPPPAPRSSASCADWFLDAAERLGDAVLDSVTTTDARQRVAQLESCLDAAPDHEILHQRLWDAVKAARLTASPAGQGAGRLT
jgi:hypothetical protein